MIQLGIMPARFLRRHETHEEAWEIAECPYLLAEFFQDALEPRQCALADGEGIRDHLQHLVALLHGEGRAHATGHRPCGMDALAAEHLDDLLAEFPQRNAVAA